MDRVYDGLLQLEDLNGSAFVIANVGEVEEDLNVLYTYLPPIESEPDELEFPYSTAYNRADDAGKARLRLWLSKVYYLNYIMLVSDSDKFRGQAKSAAALAYLRMLLVREGLADPDADPVANHCKYNLCRRVVGMEERYIGAPDWFARVHQATIAANNENYTPAQFRAQYSGGAGTAAGNVNPWVARPRPDLTQVEMKTLREQFTDIVCLVAFMFRTRAHHWTPEMDPTYRRLWKGCVRSQGREQPLCDWEACARYLCKTPFPLQLDTFWGQSITESKCSAKLAIRWEAPAAGTAGVVAIRRGYDDLRAAFPILEDKMQESVTALEAQEQKLRDSRWGASINSTYYGVAANRVDERGLAPLAATIISALNHYAENSPLVKSKALERLASSAPIVGNVIATVLTKVAAHDSVIYSFLPDDVKAAMSRQVM